MCCRHVKNIFLCDITVFMGLEVLVISFYKHLCTVLTFSFLVNKNSLEGYISKTMDPDQTAPLGAV